MLTMTVTSTLFGLMEEVNSLPKMDQANNCLQLDPDRQGELDGEPNGLYCQKYLLSKTLQYCLNLIWGGIKSRFRRDDSIHITWFESGAMVDSNVVELR